MINFDPDKNAVFNPTSFGMANFPHKALIIYDDDYFEKLASINKLVQVYDSNGNKKDNLYILGNEYLIMNPGEGAPTSAIMLEMAIASGVNAVVAFGTAGSLEGGMLPHSIIIPVAAVREEGVSYHYLPDSNEVEQKQENVDILKKIIEKYELDYAVGKTWTTDAFFRETKGKIAEMKARGCVCVDMECSALIAISKFRDIKFVQFLLSYDNLEANHNHRALYKGLTDDIVLNIAFETLDSL